MHSAQLDYARLPPQRSWIWRWRWVLASLLILVVAFGFFFTRSGQWLNSDACELCSAIRTRKGLRLFGWHVETSNIIDLGAAGKSLEKHDGMPCNHSWKFASFTSPAIRASGAGLGPAQAHRFLRVPFMEAVLDSHLKSDFDFAAKLRRYIQDCDGYSPWVEMLYNEATALQQATSRPGP